MADHSGARKVQVVHQPHDEVGVRGNRLRAGAGAIAATASHQVEDDESPADRHQRREEAPCERRTGESMQQHHGISTPTRACRVVVEPRSANIHELASHRAKSRGCSPRHKHRTQLRKGVTGAEMAEKRTGESREML